jgi:hypothetical protein
MDVCTLSARLKGNEMYRKKHIFQASRASGYQVKDINAVILN